MTDLLLLVLLSLILDYVDLLGLAILNNVCNYGCTSYIGSTNSKRLTGNAKNLIKGNLCAFLNTKLLNEDYVSLGNLILLSTCFDLVAALPW